MKTITAAQYRKTGGMPKGRPRFGRAAREDREYRGVVYASYCEKVFAVSLDLERVGAPGIWWIRQPRFDLAGAVYTADFLVVRPGEPLEGCCAVTVYEVKPLMHPPQDPKKLARFTRFRAEVLRTFRRNEKQVKALYGVAVELVEM